MNASESMGNFHSQWLFCYITGSQSLVFFVLRVFSCIDTMI